MMVYLRKSDLINLMMAIKPSQEMCLQFTLRGLMTPCGNSHNEDWRWVTTELNKMTEEEIWNLYRRFTPYKNENSETSKG
jgi:hypothetical protein